MHTLLSEALPEELDKSIHDLTAKIIHSIAFHELPDMWPQPLPTLLGHIYFNSDRGQIL